MKLRRKSIKILFILIVSVVLISCSSNSVKINKEAEYSLLRGINYSQQGEYGKAIGEYLNSYSINPNNIILLKEIGYNYYQLGDYTQAEKYWLKAFNLNPQDEGVLKNLATLYYGEKEYIKSLEIMEKSYNNKDEYLLKLKGLIAYNRKDLEKSYYFLKDIPIEDHTLETSLVYIEILGKLDNRDELLTFIEEIYPYLRGRKNFVLNCSQLLSDFNLEKESERVLMDYLVSNGSDDEVLLQLSKLYFKIGEETKGNNTLKLISNESLMF